MKIKLTREDFKSFIEQVKETQRKRMYAQLFDNILLASLLKEIKKFPKAKVKK